MLFNRESDYAVRIVRALGDGEKYSVREICAREEIPEAFAYKILRKLKSCGIVKVARGIQGGVELDRLPRQLTLYDIVACIEPDFAVMHCLKEDCSRNRGGNPCRVHQELIRVQENVTRDLKSKSLAEILGQGRGRGAAEEADADHRSKVDSDETVCTKTDGSIEM